MRDTPKLEALPLLSQFFAADGVLARASGFRFEPRPGQYRMAVFVEQALIERQHLLVEAGTGTGKTMAYLYPALRFAHATGKRIIVSTGTKALQEQLFYKDVPLLQSIFGKLNIVYLKGRSNYLCRQKLHDLHRYGLTAQELMEQDVILQWEKVTETGDRGELVNLPDTSPLWRRLDARSEDCTGKKCPSYQNCFVSAARKAASDAHIVIVNHALFFTDLVLQIKDPEAAILPPAHAIVFDEAHELESVASESFGLSVSNRRIAELVSDALKAVSGRSRADQVEVAGRQLIERFDLLCRLLPVDNEATRVGFENRKTFRLENVEICNGVISSLERFFRELEMVPSFEDDTGIKERSKQIYAELRYLLECDDRGSIFWIERRPAGLGKGSNTHLIATPIDVSEILGDRLFGSYNATVLCSATLAVQSKFEHIHRSLGVGDASELIVPSSFNYEKQAVLYLPPDMPDPRDELYFERAKAVTLDLLNTSQGRAFCLFTSYKAMQQMYSAVKDVLPYRILLHGTTSRKALLDEFRKTKNAVLFGTSSFWQGVDVQGEQLSCVIIDRLPFAVPNDPVVVARTQAIEAAGGSGFFDYQIPRAVIALNQGFGRLIRSATDRGVLSILDPRIRHPRYGQIFLNSLPSYTMTSDLTKVREFLWTGAAIA